ncbi:MAG: c-type cytochrome [Caldimonas sp.]
MKTTSLAALAAAFVVFSGAAFAGAGEDLIEANKCGKCHTATTTKKAPSFASVAQKYKGDATKQAKLVEMLKNGSDDHQAIKASEADLKAMVAVVLSSK